MVGIIVPSQGRGVLLRDEDYYLYKIVRTNKTEDRAWYRCVKENTLFCRATAIFNPKTGLIHKRNREHNHEPTMLEQVARLEAATSSD
jgi:hypothetical protein